MARGYWRTVHDKAFADARTALSIESGAKAVISLIGAITAIAFVWLFGGSSGAYGELVTRIAATAGIVSLFPAVYLWKFFQAPAALDREREQRLATMSEQIKALSQAKELQEAHTAAIREQTDALLRVGGKNGADRVIRDVIQVPVRAILFTFRGEDSFRILLQDVNLSDKTHVILRLGSGDPLKPEWHSGDSDYESIGGDGNQTTCSYVPILHHSDTSDEQRARIEIDLSGLSAEGGYAVISSKAWFPARRDGALVYRSASGTYQLKATRTRMSCVQIVPGSGTIQCYMSGEPTSPPPRSA